MELRKMHRYPVGSVVQHRTGYIFIKVEEKKWVSEHRLVCATQVENRELMNAEKVYHKDGNRENNKPDNLVAIKFNRTRYRLLPSSKPLYIPSSQREPVKTALKERDLVT